MPPSPVFWCKPDRIIAFTFIVGSSLAGVGSVLVRMKYPKIDPLMGMMIGLKAFVAAVLGGIGNVGGAVLGALIMGLSEEMVVGYLSSTYRDALAFGILIVILIFKPARPFSVNTLWRRCNARDKVSPSGFCRTCNFRSDFLISL